MTRKMAVQARPTLSKLIAPWNGFLGPVRCVVCMFQESIMIPRHDTDKDGKTKWIRVNNASINNSFSSLHARVSSFVFLAKKIRKQLWSRTGKDEGKETSVDISRREDVNCTVYTRKDLEWRSRRETRRTEQQQQEEKRRNGSRTRNMHFLSHSWFHCIVNPTV